MKIEQRIRAAFRSSANTVVPGPLRIEDVIAPSDGRRISLRVSRVLRYALPAVLVTGVSATAITMISRGGERPGPSAAGPNSVAETPSPSILPSLSPSVPIPAPTPTSSPTRAGWKGIDLADGTWYLEYPGNWIVENRPTQGPNGEPEWNIHTPFQDSTRGHMTDGEAAFTVGRWNADFDTMRKKYCDPAQYQPDGTLDSCELVTINQRTWLRIRAHDDISGGARSVGVMSSTKGFTFAAFGIVPNGDNQASSLRLLDDIFQTFVVREPA